MKNLISALIFSICLPLLSFAEVKSVSPVKQDIKTVVFAGGCFWCMQPPFDALKAKGVISTSVGYSGGHTAAPTYEQ
ncbi:MAG: peptide-methionine (S)-S-oxide reductase, partial [Pseudobdellovibrio sp.]